MNLKEIIADAEFKDDTPITFGDKQFTLGEIRAVDRERGDFQTRAEKSAGELQTWQEKHNKLAESVTTLLGAAGRQADQEPARQLDPQDALREALRPLLEKDSPSKALFEDKVFGSALKEVEERAYGRMTPELKAMKETLDALKTEFGGHITNLAKAQVLEREHRWYGENKTDIPKGEDGKRLSLDQVKQYAQERGMVIPGTNLLNLDGALDSLTAPAKQQAELKRIEQEAYQKGIIAGRSGAAKVIPIMSERGGGTPAQKGQETAGKSARQIMEGAIGAGLADAMATAGNE